MSWAVEIFDRNADNVSAVELPDLLRVLSPWGQSLKWSVKWIRGVGDIRSVWPEGILAFEHWLDQHPEGLTMDWQQFVKFSDLPEQVIDLGVVGYSHGTAQIAIIALDGSLWRVEAVDRAPIHVVRQTFRHVTDASAELLEDERSGGAP